MPQGSGGIRGPANAVSGASVVIEVQGGYSEVEVAIIGDPNTTKHAVGPDGTVTIPVPANTGGSFLLIEASGRIPPASTIIPIISLDYRSK